MASTGQFPWPSLGSPHGRQRVIPWPPMGSFSWPLTLVGGLNDRGVSVEFLDNPALSTNTPQGTFVLTVLGAVAELERAVIRERQAEGIALAKARGAYARGPKISPEQLEDARRRIADGVPKAKVARDLGVGRQTLYDALAGRGVYATSSS
ncbi:recombinase family protein [Micrococcus luteus]|nr:recombinase family protein [Micrococcus luteus]